MAEAQPRRAANAGPVLIVERPNETTAVLTLNRPERRNALSIELMESLYRTLESLAAEAPRRVAILRGNGPAFCAGLDLHEAAEAGPGHDNIEWMARTFERLATSRLVTFAAAHGAAYAGGAGLLACCDFAVAADDLRVCFPEVRRGLVPALVTALLRDRLRDRDLRELLLLAEPIDAQGALRRGLVDRVVPRERLLPETEGLVATLLKGAPEAVRETKRLLGAFWPVDIRQQIARALESHDRVRRAGEAREGAAAFHEHRQPDWPGHQE